MLRGKRLPCGKGDVCERRQWRKKRVKRSGSGQNSVGVCEQRILGTVTDVQIPFWNLIDGGHALGTTGAGARRATEGSSAETFAERIIPGQYFSA